MSAPYRLRSSDRHIAKFKYKGRDCDAVTLFQFDPTKIVFEFSDDGSFKMVMVEFSRETPECWVCCLKRTSATSQFEQLDAKIKIWNDAEEEEEEDIEPDIQTEEGEEVAAEADGMELERSSRGSTGYMGVGIRKGRYYATRRVGKRKVNLGDYNSSVEAAVAYARAKPTSLAVSHGGELLPLGPSGDVVVTGTVGSEVIDLRVTLRDTVGADLDFADVAGKLTVDGDTTDGSAPIPGLFFPPSIKDAPKRIALTFTPKDGPTLEARCGRDMSPNTLTLPPPLSSTIGFRCPRAAGGPETHRAARRPQQPHQCPARPH